MTGGSFLASSIQRVTVCTEGRTRTRLRRLLISAIAVGKLLRIAKSQFVDGAYARGAQQFGIFPADAFDPHTINSRHPIEHALFRRAGFGRDLEPLFRRLWQAATSRSWFNPIRFEDRGDLRPDLLNSVMGYPITCPRNLPSNIANSLKQIVRDRELPPRPRRSSHCLSSRAHRPARCGRHPAPRSCSAPPTSSACRRPPSRS